VKLRQAVNVSAVLIACLSCRERGREKAVSAAFDAKLSSLSREVSKSYADIAFAAYADAANEAKKLLAAADDFTAAPSAERLAVAKAAWIAARKPYLQTEVFRFYDGPIDKVETRINTWPIDEGYVEAGIAGKTPGIIEDTTKYPALTAELLAALNAKDGETSISTGYHVIEYLLWGRDSRADGPGDRPYTDYVAEKGDSTLAQRRGTYLHVACELLLRDLEQVVDEWDPARAGNYRERFLRLAPKEALAVIVKGMGSLSGPELSGERLTVPYETKDQENEHSCFSDTTSSDIAFDALGIENVGMGRYTRVDGRTVNGIGLVSLVSERDATLGQRLKAELARSVASARSIPTPFDRAIVGADGTPGRTAIWSTIQALQHQTETLAEVAAAFDLRVTLAAPRVKR
jgi:putative iron-regulated protein